MRAQKRYQSSMPTEFDLDTTCPYGHASTKHLLNSGSSLSLEHADASNRARSRILAKFAAFLSKDNAPFEQSYVQFNDLAAKAYALNNRAPSSLSQILPISENRSYEQVWDRFMQAGSQMSSFLSFHHTEAFGKHGNHSKAASSVVQGLFGPLWEEFSNRVRASNWAFIAGDPRYCGVITPDEPLPISEQDVVTLKAYQLLQERWMHQKDILSLNAELSSDVNFLETIVSVQCYLCDAIGRFMEAHPEYAASKVVFGEIALWDPDKGRFAPSSRLMKAIIHNTGPWLSANAQITPLKRLYNAIDGARKFGAFEQQVCAFSKERGVWEITGVIKKVCPAKTSLFRFLEIATKKRSE